MPSLVDLPPLPAGEFVFVRHDSGSGTEFASCMYTADQMRAYALQAVEQALKNKALDEYMAASEALGDTWIDSWEVEDIANRTIFDPSFFNKEDKRFK